MDLKKRKAYIKEYKKTINRVAVDLKNDYFIKLQEILECKEVDEERNKYECKDMKLTEWIKLKINEDYNVIK